MATAPVGVNEAQPVGPVQPSKIMPFPVKDSGTSDEFPKDMWVISVSGKFKEAQQVDTSVEKQNEVTQEFRLELTKDPPVIESQVMLLVFDSIRQVGGLTTKNENGTYSFYGFDLFSRFTAKATIEGVSS